MTITNPTLVMFTETQHSHTKKSTIIIPTEKLCYCPKQIPDTSHFTLPPSKIKINFSHIFFNQISQKQKCIPNNEEVPSILGQRHGSIQKIKIKLNYFLFAISV